MTKKEQLEHLVAELGEEDAARALQLLQATLPAQPPARGRRNLPAFVGMGDSGRGDLTGHQATVDRLSDVLGVVRGGGGRARRTGEAFAEVLRDERRRS